MQIFAISLRDIPISAKKMGMWTDVVRRKHIDDAIVQCEMAHKKAAKICLKVRKLSLPQVCKKAELAYPLYVHTMHVHWTSVSISQLRKPSSRQRHNLC